MTSRIAPRILVFIWLAVLASPIAWGASLVTMFWLTHPVCQGLSRSVLTGVGMLCALLALAGAIAAGRGLRRASGLRADDEEVGRFLLRLAMWGGLIFTLVIVLSLVPTALLTPCPV